MTRNHTPPLLLCLLMLALLGGCAAKDPDSGSSLSLMERYHSGKDILNDGVGVKATPQTKAEEAQKHLQRGLVYASQNRHELAFEQFSRAAALDPNLTEARYQRGALLVKRGAAQEAMSDMVSVIAADPQHALARETAGVIYFESGLLDEAEASFRRALELNPKLLRSALYLGTVHNYRKEHDKALAVFGNALARTPLSPDIHNNMGITCSLLGRDAEAVGHFRTAVGLGASSERVWNNLGLVLCRMGKHEEAFEAFRNAGGEAAAHNNLGYYLLQNGDPVRAITHLQRAIELEPRYYARASENLKRARLAARFVESDNGVVTPASPATMPPMQQKGKVAPARVQQTPTQTLPVVVPAAGPQSMRGVQERTIMEAQAPMP